MIVIGAGPAGAAAAIQAARAGASVVVFEKAGPGRDKVCGDGLTPRAVGALQALSAAQATVADMTAFCDRNPAVCTTGGAAFKVFADKARNGARMIYKKIRTTSMPHNRSCRSLRISSIGSIPSTQKK